MLAAMFLRCNRRRVAGETYEYWTLVRTVRTAKGPRQEVVAALGKEPGLEEKVRRGWEQIGDLLEGRAPAPVQGQLGKRLAELERPQWAQVDLGSAALQLARVVGAEGRQRTREPDGEAGQDEPEDQ